MTAQRPNAVDSKINLHDSQRAAVLRYVQALDLYSSKGGVFNERFAEFKYLVHSLPNCKDLAEADVISLASSAYMLFCRNYDPNQTPPSDLPDRAARYLISYIESLPREYSVQITLPSVPYWGEYEVALTPETILKSSEPREVAENKRIAALGRKDQDPYIAISPVMLQVRISGFAQPIGRSGSTQPAVADALSTVKQLLFVLNLTRAVTTLSLKQAAARAHYLDVAADTSIPCELPGPLARALGTLEPASDALGIEEPGGTLLTPKIRPAANDPEKVLAFTRRLEFASRFFGRGSVPGFGRIVAAIEWYQDSAFQEDETMAFIAACIGLESILGDEDRGMSELSNRLTDRYAFMLGRDRQDRRRLAEEFTGILRVRGELVHARTTRLRARQREQLFIAQRMLQDVIRHEMRPILFDEPLGPGAPRSGPEDQ
ncbi:hypothetical protein [Ramlibacter sp. AN1133]|uniref:hypothetical protein n=1 Tax=Ramlibacter sp. AN1133 TaxID=3133429 RepID=UPI0030BFA6AD